MGLKFAVLLLMYNQYLLCIKSSAQKHPVLAPLYYHR